MVNLIVTGLTKIPHLVVENPEITGMDGNIESLDNKEIRGIKENLEDKGLTNELAKKKIKELPLHTQELKD